MSNNRVDFEENNYYHIFNRWFEKQIIFKSNSDFSRFYTYVVKYQKEYENSIKILAYSFLPNHFHFIFHITETGLNLSNFMRKVQWAYAMYFKRKYWEKLETGLSNIRWPLFEWRFKAKIIDTDDYLYQCMSYVCFNPLKHKIVDNIDDYPWTSYHQLNKTDKVNKYKDLELDDLEF